MRLAEKLHWKELTTVTLATTDNKLPEDGVTATKHVGAILV
jgi:hypothetical protein